MPMMASPRSYRSKVIIRDRTDDALKLQRDVIARGVFTSTADLARKLRRYINAYSKDAKPFKWIYSDPSRRIRHGKSIS